MFLYRSWAVRRYSPAVTPHPIHNNDIIPTCFNKLIFPSLVENAEVPNNFRLSRENKFLHEEGNCIHLQTNKRLILDAPLIRFVIKGPTQKHPFHIRLENVWGLMVSPRCICVSLTEKHPRYPRRSGNCNRAFVLFYYDNVFEWIRPRW